MDRQSATRWFWSIIISLFVFGASSYYAFLMRPTLSLSTFNKGFATTAVILAGITLFFWPLSRLISITSLFLPSRHQLGIMAFVSASFHMIISLFFIPARFPFSWFVQQWLPTILGFTAIIVWLYLTYISTPNKIHTMESKSWRFQQSYLGQISFLVIYFHLIALKYASWITWWQTRTIYPPLNLLVFLFMSGIILIRIYHRITNLYEFTNKK